jgi:hypothetical protein
VIGQLGTLMLLRETHRIADGREEKLPQAHVLERQALKQILFLRRGSQLQRQKKPETKNPPADCQDTRPNMGTLYS